MSAIWPLDLPQRPQVESYSKKHPNQLLRSEMETGSAKVRRRGKSKPHQLTLKYIFDTNELQLFTDFVEIAISDGAVCFDWPHPVHNRYVRARFVGGQDSLFTEQPYKNTLHFEVNFILEYWPDAPLT